MAAWGTSKARHPWRRAWLVAALGAATALSGMRKYLVTSTGSVLQQTVSLAASVRAYTFSGLTAGKSYRFSATALNSQGAGVTSAKITAFTP